MNGIDEIRIDQIRARVTLGLAKYPDDSEARVFYEGGYRGYLEHEILWLANELEMATAIKDAALRALDKPGWIPVEELSPANCQQVLAWCVGKSKSADQQEKRGVAKRVMYNTGGCDGKGYFGVEVNVTVTHWMLLPEGPKEEA